jgi:MarR family transcriptional regulator for hemolysin
VTGARDPKNRRVQYVKLTRAGEAAFLRLREAAMKFDKQLRRGLTEVDVAALADLLTKLATNVQ